MEIWFGHARKTAFFFCCFFPWPYDKLSKKLKNSTRILVGQVVLKLWIRTAKILFSSITQEPFGVLKY